MHSQPQPAPFLKFQAFVLVNDILYKAGRQRTADALNNQRREPTIKGLAVKVWHVSMTEEGVTFGPATTAVFNEDGYVHEGIRMLSIAAMLDGRSATAYVEERLPRDDAVQRYLDLAARNFDACHLLELARVAKPLPTK